MKSQGIGWKLVLCGAVFLCLFAVQAQALVVEIDLGWGWSSTSDTDLNDYNLQEGSIIQVILYNSDTADPPGSDTDDNFDIFGDYGGTGIAADPYPGTEPSNVPDDSTIYEPYTVPDGHVLAYETTIGSATSPNAYGYDWYRVFEQFEILGTYDSIYIRVFGTTEFTDGVVISSYWGLSDVVEGGGSLDFWYVQIDDTTANKTNYFEVIPEPGTMGLLGLGAVGMLLWRRRNQSRK